jgi:hypothetical protein
MGPQQVALLLDDDILAPAQLVVVVNDEDTHEGKSGLA